jgi:type II secretory pathway component PulC
MACKPKNNSSATSELTEKIVSAAFAHSEFGAQEEVAPAPDGMAQPEPSMEAAQVSMAAPRADNELLGPEPHPPAAEHGPALPAPDAPARIQRLAGALRLDPTETDWSKWVFRSVNLMLAGLIVLLLMRIWGSFDEVQAHANVVLPSAGDYKGAADPEKASKLPPVLNNYQVIWDRNLFASAATNDVKRIEVDIEKIKLAGKEVGLKLIGTVVAKEPWLNRAILEVSKTRTQEIYHENDTAESVVIKRILRNNVIISTKNGDQRLTVDESGTDGPAAMAAVQSPSELAPRSAPEASLSGERQTRIIPPSPPNAGEAPPPADDYGMDGTTASARVINGEPDGMLVSGVEPQSSLSRFGVRPGDVVKGVNGEEIKNADDAADFFNRVSEGGDVSITVVRRGRVQTLRLPTE